MSLVSFCFLRQPHLSFTGSVVFCDTRAVEGAPSWLCSTCLLKRKRNFWIILVLTVLIWFAKCVHSRYAQQVSTEIRPKPWLSLDPSKFRHFNYSQSRSRVNSISKNEMNIRISLCNVRRVNGMLDISLKIVPKKTH